MRTLGVGTREGDAQLVHPSDAAGLPPRPGVEATLAHEAEVLAQIADGARTQRLGEGHEDRGGEGARPAAGGDLQHEQPRLLRRGDD